MLNLSSSSVQKFPLFRQLGLPVLARESMNNHAKIYQHLKTAVHLLLTALRRGKDSGKAFGNILKLCFYPEGKGAFTSHAHSLWYPLSTHRHSDQFHWLEHTDITSQIQSSVKGRLPPAWVWELPGNNAFSLVTM